MLLYIVMSIENLKIVAAGGIAPNGKVAPLLEHAVELAQPETAAQVLILLTAKTALKGHRSATGKAIDLFSRRLGGNSRILHGFGTMPDPKKVDDLFKEADVLYIGGGDTKRMMEIWGMHRIDEKIRRRAEEGMVVSGISTGAIAPFGWGHSDWHSYEVLEKGDPWDFEPINGLSLVPGVAVTPHANKKYEGQKRLDHFAEMFGGFSTPLGLAIDNFSAVQVNEGKITALTANSAYGVTVLQRDNNGALEMHRMSPTDSISL